MEAEASVFIEEDPSCSVCGEIFSVPVVLSCLACGCGFCQFCLQQFWEEQGSKECPMCSKKSDASQTKLCEEHDEKLTYFCVADLCPVCEFCFKYGSHTDHRVYPIKEAEEDCKLVNVSHHVPSPEGAWSSSSDMKPEGPMLATAIN
ncbi:hypothetical protein ACEWY4_003353 [Coilia grayii]|uniref:Uncharacterized protein n=1 Tax=Coilia grayii TaxID=363190 RepID=A0ABD1KR16_9TELE